MKEWDVKWGYAVRPRNAYEASHLASHSWGIMEGDCPDEVVRRIEKEMNTEVDFFVNLFLRTIYITDNISEAQEGE